LSPKNYTNGPDYPLFIQHGDASPGSPKAHNLPSTRQVPPLPRGRSLSGGFQFTLGEINELSAAGAPVFLVEFIGKDFLFLAAIGAFAYKGFQVLETFQSRAMQGRVHLFPSLIKLIGKQSLDLYFYFLSMLCILSMD
jgi:hypothetical protein